LRLARTPVATLTVSLVWYLFASVVSVAGAQGPPIDLGRNTEYVGPHLLVILQRHADGEVVPDLVVAKIGYRTDLEIDPPLEQFIRSRGGWEIAEYTWCIPTDETLSVVQRPDLLAMSYPSEATERDVDRYPNVDDTLKKIITAVSGDIDQERLTEYTRSHCVLGDGDTGPASPALPAAAPSATAEPTPAPAPTPAPTSTPTMAPTNTPAGPPLGSLPPPPPETNIEVRAAPKATPVAAVLEQGSAFAERSRDWGRWAMAIAGGVAAVLILAFLLIRRILGGGSPTG